MSMDQTNLTEHVPGIFFIKNVQSEFVAVSSEFARHAGVLADQMLGKTDDTMPWCEFANLYRSDDKKVLKGETIEKFEPFNSLGSIQYLSIRKNPIIQDNKIIAIAAVGQILSDDMQRKLHFLKKHDAKISPYPITSYEFKHRFNDLTIRESQILFYFLRGNSLRLIGEILSISPRTVETHIINIKNKLNVDSKAQLLELAYSLGFLQIIPWFSDNS